MEKTYHLSLTIGENHTSRPFATRQGAIDAIIDAFMVTYPDDEDVHGIPEPIEEGEMRTFLISKGLEQEFQFQITEADDQTQA